MKTPPTNVLKNPIIFIGAPRSGTTIISEMIFQHPDLAWPSNYQEKFRSWSSIDYLRRITDNKYWRIIGNKKQLHKSYKFNRYLFKPTEAYQTWARLTDKDFSRGFLINETESDKNKKRIRKYFTKIIKAQGKKRLAFKITGPPRMGYLLSIFPDAVFILIKRNPVPTISSLLKVYFWEERGKYKLWWLGPYSDKEKGWVEKNKDKPALITALQIKKINWAEQFEIDKYNPKILEIQYEDFVNQPLQDIIRILAFCGLSFDNRIEKYLEKNPVVSRNKKDNEYFDEETLQKIYRILKGELI